MNRPAAGAIDRLNQLLANSGLAALDPSTARKFEILISLILRWNSRTNLTSIRDPEGILARHLVESIVCAQALPSGIATLLDFGSGAGFPGLPIALRRPEIAVTLSESQGKKAAFLREAVRTLGLSTTIHAARAETLCTVFDCVALRAVDKMSEAVSTAARLVAPHEWLALMTTVAEQEKLQRAAGSGFLWREQMKLPGSDSRILLLGHRN